MSKKLKNDKGKQSKRQSKNSKMDISSPGNVKKEKSRIEKKVEDLEKYLTGVDKKLENKSFLKRAPKDVVDKEKAKRDKFTEQVKTLRENLQALK